MRRVGVELPDRAYPVVIGDGAIVELPAQVRALGASAVAVVTDRVVAGYWAGVVREVLAGSGVPTAL